MMCQYPEWIKNIPAEMLIRFVNADYQELTEEKLRVENREDLLWFLYPRMPPSRRINTEAKHKKCSTSKKKTQKNKKDMELLFGPTSDRHWLIKEIVGFRIDRDGFKYEVA